MITDKACCFFGHRKINETPELIKRLTKEIEVLITEKEVSIFYFGSKSEFDDLCHKTVTKLKEKYPYIKRIYVRSAFNIFTTGMKIVCLNIMKAHTFRSRLKTLAKPLTWNAIRK